jgi:hypothetical protein
MTHSPATPRSSSSKSSLVHRPPILPQASSRRSRQARLLSKPATLADSAREAGIPEWEAFACGMLAQALFVLGQRDKAFARGAARLRS